MVVAILGPTASGKSELGWPWRNDFWRDRVLRLHAGLSRMDIGTGKATKRDQARCPHHLLDLVDPGEPFHAAAWAARARTVIDDIHGRGRTPIIVGGTGLYFRALRVGFSMRRRPIHDTGTPSGRGGRPRRPSLAPATAGIDPEAAAKILPAIWFAPAAPLRCTSRPEFRSVSCAGAQSVSRFLDASLLSFSTTPRQAALAHSQPGRAHDGGRLPRRGRGSAPGRFGHTALWLAWATSSSASISTAI